MTDGNFKEFANLFGRFLLESVPQRIFGSVEAVYQDYLFAYFSGAASVKPKWNTVMETAAGTGRTDMAYWNEEWGTINEVKSVGQFFSSTTFTGANFCQLLPILTLKHSTLSSLLILPQNCIEA